MGQRAKQRWARVMHARDAAEYVGSTERLFRLDVASGVMPAPFPYAGADAWDILDLDAAVDALKAGAARMGNVDDRLERYAQARRMARHSG